MTEPQHSPLLLAARALPATLAGCGSLTATGPATLASYRERAQFVPDIWVCLELLTPLPRWLILGTALGLLLGVLGAGWRAIALVSRVVEPLN